MTKLFTCQQCHKKEKNSTWIFKNYFCTKCLKQAEGIEKSFIEFNLFPDGLDIRDF